MPGISHARRTLISRTDDPPGASTSYNCGGRNYVAGGTGTYDDPVTMATAQGEFKRCEILYVPYLHKYVRYEDFCQQCSKNNVTFFVEPNAY